jgi:predicted ATPase/DNA-binding winged helix-turn-helix (wHTH) protein
MDLTRRELRTHGAPVPLGSRAFDIVEVLARSAGELVTKDEIMRQVWSGAVVEESALQVHISAIRKAFGSDRGMLKTAFGRGYRLLGAWTIRQERISAAPVVLQIVPPTEFLTNFPPASSELIGRTGAREHLGDLLSAYRVVTLTGPGGIGKSALALAVARSMFPIFQGDGRLVELASLSDPGLVPSAVASVLDLKLGGDEISAERVARAIGDRKLFLILDNCEHVIDAAANLVETVVRLCPRTTVLATSREVLRIDGEYVYRVPPLAVPPEDQMEPEVILQHDAVELFIARTRTQAPDISLHGKNLPAIASICRHLDGIPLAIEFAAARAATLGIQQVATRLDDRFRLLTSGRRTALPRHRTLRAMLDWSYELLPDVERLLLRRLAVFPGGFTLDAAIAIVKDIGLDASAVIGGIASLVAKSLVVLHNSGATRWSLLETIRVYALDKLAEHDEVNAAARHHAAYFRDLFAPASDIGSPLSDEDLARRVREIDNVRAALDWSFSSAGHSALGIDLTVAYAPVWLNLSLMVECRERSERALRGLERDATPNTWLQMWLLIAFGSALITDTGPSEQAQTVLTRALEIADILDDLDAQARALETLMAVHTSRGEYGKAWTTVERLWQIAHQIGDPAIVTAADRLMGITLLPLGRLQEAQQCSERVLQAPISPEDQRHSVYHHSEHRAMARAMLACALWLQGLTEKALYESEASLGELRGTDHQLSVCPVLYYGLCRIAPMTGDFATADRGIARLIEVASRLDALFWKTVGRFLQGKLMIERREFARGVAEVRGAFDTCRQMGWRASYQEFKGALAVGLAGLSQLDDALDAVQEGLEGFGQREEGERWYVPELLRIKGEVLLQQPVDGSVSLAEDCFDQAGELARELGALFWELRVALSLARLRLTQGRNNEARQVLGPVYDRFTEGFGTTDMLSAKKLLKSLS